MRKTSRLLLVLAAVLLICSCTKKTDKQTESSIAAPTPSPTPSPTPEPAYLDMEISEVMPVNSAVMRDEYGSFSDWIELHNTGSITADLSDYFLSDDEEERLKWQMPKVDLAPDEYILVFATGTESTETEIHAPFKLGKNGESITLTHKDGEEVCSFSYTNAEKNKSYLADGTSTYFITPGFPNTDEGYLAYQSKIKMPNGLVITEAMTANSSVAPHDGEYSDWVELYNNSDAEINISEYFLSDDNDNLLKCRLPDRTLAAHEFTIIYCDKKDAKFKSFVSGFSLGSEDDVYLTKDGEICDFISLHSIPYKYSYGRDTEGYAYFSSPSPYHTGSNGIRMIAKAPHTSVPQGVYNNVDSISVELTGEGTIYYTTDGSEPGTHSKKYSSAVTLKKTTVIRAISITDDKINSRITTASYIINENHVLPVLSLATDSDNLFSPETGIYVEGNHQNYYQDWEKPASITLFENGETRFTSDCGLKMFGSGSRADCNKKSMRVNFKSKYGVSKLKCDVFNDGITGYKSLVMRGGEDTPSTIFRNELFTSLAKESNLLVQNSKFCVLYVDGEYFGIFCLCERLSDAYYSQHFGIDESLVEVAEAPTSSETAMGRLIRYAQTHDMSTDESYKYMNKHLDLDGMIDWFVFQAYSHNRDLSGNIRYFHRADTDFVQYSFYDLDWAFYKRGDRFDILNNGEQYSVIIHAMMENITFRERFVKRTAKLLNGVLSDKNVLARIDYYTGLLEPEMPRERQRWSRADDGRTVDVKSWERAVERMRSYVTQSSIKEEMIDSLMHQIHLTDDEASYIRG